MLSIRLPDVAAKCSIALDRQDSGPTRAIRYSLLAIDYTGYRDGRTLLLASDWWWLIVDAFITSNAASDKPRSLIPSGECVSMNISVFFLSNHVMSVTGLYIECENNACGNISFRVPRTFAFFQVNENEWKCWFARRGEITRCQLIVK